MIYSKDWFDIDNIRKLDRIVKNKVEAPKVEKNWSCAEPIKQVKEQHIA